MAMDLAHVGCGAGELVGYTVTSHGAEGILVYGYFCTDMTATFAQIYVTSGAEINTTDAVAKRLFRGIRSYTILLKKLAALVFSCVLVIAEQ